MKKQCPVTKPISRTTEAKVPSARYYDSCDIGLVYIRNILRILTAKKDF